MSARKILGVCAAGLFWLSGTASAEQAVIFAHYNIENYLEKDRVEGGETAFGPKPEREKAILIRIIKEIHPDILGVAEMGPPDQFEEFQQRLRAAGLEFSFIHVESVLGVTPSLFTIDGGLVTVTGLNFRSSSSLACQFDASTVVTAEFVSSTAVT